MMQPVTGGAIQKTAGLCFATRDRHAGDTLARTRGLRADYVVLDSGRPRLAELARLAVEGQLRPIAPDIFSLDEAPPVFAAYVAGARAGTPVMRAAR
jgi:hypothetical protein